MEHASSISRFFEDWRFWDRGFWDSGLESAAVVSVALLLTFFSHARGLRLLAHAKPGWRRQTTSVVAFTIGFWAAACGPWFVGMVDSTERCLLRLFLASVGALLALAVVLLRAPTRWN